MNLALDTLISPSIAIALTACGIETSRIQVFAASMELKIAIALTACGIETCGNSLLTILQNQRIAIALTACGIETLHINSRC